MKSGAFSGRAFDVNFPAVVVANALDDSETDAQPFALSRTPEETLIQEGQVKWLDANSRNRRLKDGFG